MINAVGTIFVAKDTGRICMCLRSPTSSYRLSWSLWGGKVEPGEYLGEALHRELSEEISNKPTILKTIPLDSYMSRDGHFKYVSYVSIVDVEFVPSLNHENAGYCWIDVDCYPRPMHPGARNVLTNKLNRDKLRTIIDSLDSYEADSSDVGATGTER